MFFVRSTRRLFRTSRTLCASMFVCSGCDTIASSTTTVPPAGQEGLVCRVPHTCHSHKHIGAYGVSRPTDKLVGQTKTRPSSQDRAKEEEGQKNHLPTRGIICLSHEAREKSAHLRAHEIPRLAVLHQVHLAEGPLPEHLDRLILFHPFSCDLKGVPGRYEQPSQGSQPRVSVRFFNLLLAYLPRLSGGRVRRLQTSLSRVKPWANPVSRAEF